jgi:SSS family solute:Na+ symporter
MSALSARSLASLATESGYEGNAYAAWALGLSVSAVVLFGVLALVLLKREKTANVYAVETTEFFFTARASKQKWKVAWSFFSSAVGSFVISGMPDFAFWGGLIGLLAYAFSAALPIVLIGHFGSSLQERYPRILSLSDYGRLRFGFATQVLVVLMTLFNTSIACCAEYTTIASLMSYYVALGGFDVLFVALLGVVTLTYTTAGGLSVSIITDQFQGVSSFALFAVIMTFVAATWRVPGGAYQPDAIGPELTAQLWGLSELGWTSLFVMPFSLLTGTVFSEAMWQRVWASEDRATVRFGSRVGALLVFMVCFGIGFTGILGGWAYGADMFDANPNLRLFYVLKPFEDQFVPVVNSAIGVLVVLFAVVMSESAIDSMQNAVGACLNGALQGRAPGYSLRVGQAMVAAINIPLIVVGTLKIKVLALFLVANMVGACAVFPVLLGIVRLAWVDRYLTDMVPPVSFAITMLFLAGFGVSQVDGHGFVDGLSMAFYDNMYGWKYFLVALGCSVGSTFALMGLNALLGVRRADQDEHLEHDDAVRVPDAEAATQADVKPVTTTSIQLI